MKIKLIKKYHEQTNITYPNNIYYFWDENNADSKLNTIVECLVLEIKDGSWIKDFLSTPNWHAAGEIIGIYDRLIESGGENNDEHCMVVFLFGNQSSSKE